MTFPNGVDGDLPEVMLSLKNPDLRVMADLYYQIQKARVAMGNRKSAIERGVDSGDTAWLASWQERLHGMEAEIVGDMGRLLHEQPAWVWLKTVKGIGPTLGGKVIALIDDIGKFDTISKLWSFAGYGLYPDADGNLGIQKLTKGQKATFNRRLKTAIYLVGSSFLKSGGRFSDVYYEAKRHYEQTHPEWTDGHRHNAAMRKMGKVYLACLWLAWRQAEGLPVRDPYIIGRNGHVTVYSTESFSEKE